MSPDVVVGLMTCVCSLRSSCASSYTTTSKEKPRRDDFVRVENWMTPPEENAIHSWPVCEQTSESRSRQPGMPCTLSPGLRPNILRNRSSISIVVE